MKKIIIILIILIAIGIGWYTLSPFFIRSSINEVSPLNNVGSDNSTSSAATTSEPGLISPGVIAEGNFISQEHEVSGKVMLINVGDQQVIRFEDFTTLNGPDLRVYLSKDLEAKDFVDAGKLKATDGNMNYELATNVDINQYKYVLIWCKDFKVLFGSAELK